MIRVGAGIEVLAPSPRAAGKVAEQEPTRLIERTKAGLERARREGKRLGRPPASPVLLHAARDLVVDGVPVRDGAGLGWHRRSGSRRPS